MNTTCVGCSMAHSVLKALRIIFDSPEDFGRKKIIALVTAAYGCTSEDAVAFISGRKKPSTEEFINFSEYGEKYSEEIPNSQPWSKKLWELEEMGLLKHLQPT